jgi:dTDP-4-amino-4,6-dideoxygalactose transaminase
MVTNPGNSYVRMSVPLLDLEPQYQSIKEEIRQALDEVITSQQFILGPKVSEFEGKVAGYCQCRYGVGVSSGTDALLLALMALEIGHDDEVITTPYTFFATAGTIARLGARPLFCDIDSDTFNLSSSAVESLISEKCEFRGNGLINRDNGNQVKALLPVHLYGQVADMDGLLRTARKYNLRVVEDAAQAIGAEYLGGYRAGTLGDIACFSFFPTKNLGAFGDAGMCTTNDQELEDKLRVLRVHGMKPKYYHDLIGGNFRLDTIQAAVLLVKLKYLDQWTAKRQGNARYYTELITERELLAHVTPPRAREGYRHVYNQYVIRVQKRDELRSYLADAKIGTETYYPVSLHTQRCFNYLNYRADAFPESTRAANETLALPIYPELSREQQRYVIDKVAEFYYEQSKLT